ncbi:MAG TPA: hypothetical protein PKL47_09370 [Rectinema sp.]|nr:hypothetical protein [Rectinema sp.]
MHSIVELDKLFHRSKTRIKDIGEVFTPESYVEEMLDLLSKNKRGIWSDENISFFEPCAGHGNIVLPIYKRRLEAIYKKALPMGIKEAAYYAVANSLNTLWAIDIDAQNIEDCRSRILSYTIGFLKLKLNVESERQMFADKKDFFAHILAAIKWHIEVNETLSALSSPDTAKENANLTKSGGKWFAQNGHHQIDFNTSWVAFYEECERSDTVPMEFERASRFIEAVISGKPNKGFEDYQFAKMALKFGTQQNLNSTTDSFYLGA